MAYDYGTCHVCGSPIEERFTEQSVRTDGSWILIRSVPAGACSKCGEQIFRWDVAERMEHIVQQRDEAAPDQRIEVPVFAY
jgi:YgiT-type zinc finger domain-containing protein